MGGNRATLDGMIDALFRGDFDGVAGALADDAVVDYPQSGERLVGRQACLNVYRNYPGGPPTYALTRVSGGPDVFFVEATADYAGDKLLMTSIVEFRDGKVAHQTDYWASPFPAPAWRSQWVEPIA